MKNKSMLLGAILCAVGFLCGCIGSTKASVTKGSDGSATASVEVTKDK